MKSLDLIFEETRRQLELQVRRIESIDGKIGIIFGFTGVIFGIVATVEAKTFVLKIVIGFLMISLILGLGAFWFKRYVEDPNPKALEKYYLEKESIETKRQILANYTASYEKNRKTLSKKLLIAKISWIFLLLSVIFIAINFLKGG